MEDSIKIFIYVHAVLGGIALVLGAGALVAKKGSKIHKKSGKGFFYTMLLSAILAIIISVLPNHVSPFLFAVGIFTSYFLLSGYGSLKFKTGKKASISDKIISWIMAVVGIGMITLPVILSNTINIVLTAFGVIGLSLAIRDLTLYIKPEELRRSWLRLHLGKMIGGYIAAVTAFVVVNDFFPSLYGWFVPGIVGGIYIIYWMRKLKPGQTKV